MASVSTLPLPELFPLPVMPLTSTDRSMSLTRNGSPVGQRHSTSSNGSRERVKNPIDLNAFHAFHWATSLLSRSSTT